MERYHILVQGCDLSPALHFTQLHTNHLTPATTFHSCDRKCTPYAATHSPHAPPMLPHTHPASFPASFAGELAARILKDSRRIQCQYGEPFFRLAVLRSCFVCHASFVITEILVRSCAGWPQRQDSAKNRHSSWQASQCVACLAP